MTYHFFLLPLAERPLVEPDEEPSSNNEPPAPPPSEGGAVNEMPGPPRGPPPLAAGEPNANGEKPEKPALGAVAPAVLGAGVPNAKGVPAGAAGVGAAPVGCDCDGVAENENPPTEKPDAKEEGAAGVWVAGWNPDPSVGVVAGKADTPAVKPEPSPGAEDAGVNAEEDGVALLGVEEAAAEGKPPVASVEEGAVKPAVAVTNGNEKPDAVVDEEEAEAAEEDGRAKPNDGVVEAAAGVVAVGRVNAEVVEGVGVGVGVAKGVNPVEVACVVGVSENPEDALVRDVAAGCEVVDDGADGVKLGRVKPPIVGVEGAVVVVVGVLEVDDEGNPNVRPLDEGVERDVEVEVVDGAGIEAVVNDGAADEDDADDVLLEGVPNVNELVAVVVVEEGVVEVLVEDDDC